MVANMKSLKKMPFNKSTNLFEHFKDLSNFLKNINLLKNHILISYESFVDWLIIKYGVAKVNQKFFMIKVMLLFMIL